MTIAKVKKVKENFKRIITFNNFLLQLAKDIEE